MASFFRKLLGGKSKTSKTSVTNSEIQQPQPLTWIQEFQWIAPENFGYRIYLFYSFSFYLYFTIFRSDEYGISQQQLLESYKSDKQVSVHQFSKIESGLNNLKIGRNITSNLGCYACLRKKYSRKKASRI
jgi:hypothetical protein